MKPCSMTGRILHPHPFQDYVVTYTDGNEVDIIETLSDERPSSRPRVANADLALTVHVASRVSVRAPYMKDLTESSGGEGPAMAHRCSEESVVSLRGCSANLMEIEW